MSQNLVFDFSKLKGRIVEKVGTQKELYQLLGWSNSTLALKLANKTRFSGKDILDICKILEIPNEEIGTYFFTLAN